MIYWEYAGEDVCLPVDQEAHCLDAYKSNIDDIVLGKASLALPIVLVSKNLRATFL